MFMDVRILGVLRSDTAEISLAQLYIREDPDWVELNSKD